MNTTATSVCTDPVVPAEPVWFPPHGHYRVCDLFAGAGGLSEGLSHAGYEIVVANELDPVAAKTYALNHPQTRLVIGDIKLKKTKDEICACFVDQPCDLLAGGVCCQSWSSAGKRDGFGDPRGLLWFTYLEMLQRLKPRSAIAENVPAVLQHVEALKAILEIYSYLGYHAEYRVLNAVDHGVAQTRKRLFIIATRRDWRDLPVLWPQQELAANTGGLQQ